MNEIRILNYIIRRLETADIDGGIDILAAELRTAVKALKCVPSYSRDDVINALFEEVSADA